MKIKPITKEIDIRFQKCKMIFPDYFAFIIFGSILTSKSFKPKKTK
jgi:hypothetical protein